jgi:hypothetical protein
MCAARQQPHCAAGERWGAHHVEGGVGPVHRAVAAAVVGVPGGGAEALNVPAGGGGGAVCAVIRPGLLPAGSAAPRPGCSAPPSVTDRYVGFVVLVAGKSGLQCAYGMSVSVSLLEGMPTPAYRPSFQYQS